MGNYSIRKVCGAYVEEDLECFRNYRRNAKIWASLVVHTAYNGVLEEIKRRPKSFGDQFVWQWLGAFGKRGMPTFEDKPSESHEVWSKTVSMASLWASMSNLITVTWWIFSF